MAKLKVTGIPLLDGEYELDISSFTNRELHLIKQETGVRAGEIPAAFEAGDNDMLVAITMIVLQRSGKGQVAQMKDLLWDAEAGSITFDFSEEEKTAAELERADDALPPASEPKPDGGEPGRSETSGSSSGNGSESLVSLPSRTGPQRSATGAA